MGAMLLNEKIDMYFNEFFKDFKDKGKEFKPSRSNLYKLGKILTNNIPEIIETREGKYKYVSWKWYLYILRKLDKDTTFWISHSDQYRVETTIKFYGNEYKFSYGVCDSPTKKDGTPLNSVSEMYVNEGMRCYAKNVSVNTELFWHLWIEGGNTW